MRVYYHCGRCGASVAHLDTTGIDEGKLGLDRLTAEERGDIITVDEIGTMHIQTLCDRCIDALGITGGRVSAESIYTRIQ